MRIHRLTVLAAIWMATVSGVATAQNASSPAASAHWKGEIQIPDQILGIAVELTRNQAGRWIGSMSVAGTSAVDVPLTSVTVDGAAVQFTAGLPGATFFDGHLSGDGVTLSGRVSNDQGGVPFVLTRDGDAHVKAPSPSSELPREFEGAWEGMVESRGRTMRVALALSRDVAGMATATIVNRDQGGEIIPATTVTVEGRVLQLEARAISGAFRGTLNDRGQIVGEWSEGGNHLPLTFARIGTEAK